VRAMVCPGVGELGWESCGGVPWGVRAVVCPRTHCYSGKPFSLVTFLSICKAFCATLLSYQHLPASHGPERDSSLRLFLLEPQKPSQAAVT
jgi:hypothetical protein